ncbi:uncharacterized protein LOC121738599 isoform X2 [Aricia agestis]|uniref:uncharacterized protein LOC121738599 isoform X2 n=1 Tax=Aricia agestis TaxID=91739 RepID=UPI001C208036|nr:uncharacterized protein LOC121738599 isoform X2 [Aricia agestis]
MINTEMSKVPSAFYLLGLFLSIQPQSASTLNATNYSFVEYIQNFNPSKVWERIEVRNKQNGRNTTVRDEFEEILKSIDQTDVLLQLKVQDGNPKILIQKDGRRWKPPLNYDRGIVPDIFHLRRRYIELMKQAIYQTRNKMIVMQELREKYRDVSVYKMGFLMAKTDRACKKFSNIAYKAFRLCSQMRQSATDGVYFQDMLELEERMLNLWMDIDLLVHLVTINDENCRRMLNQVMTNRKKEWKFVN